MKLILDLPVEPCKSKITYPDSIVMIGSCFSEEIGNRLQELKFDISLNPNGIIYDPLTICRSIDHLIDGRGYKESDLFEANGLWNSWQHHSSFSAVNKNEALDNINIAGNNASQKLSSAAWLIITLGSAYYYQLRNTGENVANCHKVSSGSFVKKLLETGQIINELRQTLTSLRNNNPKINIMLTVSPVRYVRDGIIENNLSKARLIDSVHDLCSNMERAYYFPAYELMIDVLRDYRFYKDDLVHPTTTAVNYVFERFSDFAIASPDRGIMEEISKLVTATKHRGLHEESEMHKQFRKTYLQRANALQVLYPYLDFKKEIEYFT